MDFNAIIKRVINLITKTKEEWDKIKGETSTIKDLYLKYAVVVYALPSVAILIGWIIARAPILMSLGMAIALYILTLGVILLIGLLIDVIGPQFGATKDMVSSQKLAVYSLTPYAVLGILFILPMRGFFYGGGGLFYLIMIVSLYSFYLMYVGALKLKGISPDKVIPFIAIMAVIWLVLIYIDFRLSGEIAAQIFVGSLRARFGGF